MIFLRKKFPNNFFLLKKLMSEICATLKIQIQKNTHCGFLERDALIFLTGLDVGKIETDLLFLETPISTG